MRMASGEVTYILAQIWENILAQIWENGAPKAPENFFGLPQADKKSFFPCV